MAVAAVGALLAWLAPSVALADDPNGDGINGPPTMPDYNYELVTSADKRGANVDPMAPLLRADGKRALTVSLEPFGETPSSAFQTSYISTRTEEGWETAGITPLQGQQFDISPAIPVLDFDPTWSKTAFRSAAPLVDGVTPNTVNYYLRDNESGAVEWLTPTALPGAFYLSLSPDVPWSWGDSTPDLSKGIFGSIDNLTTDASGPSSKTYVWNRGGEVELASVDTAGDPLPTPSTPAGSYTYDKGTSPTVPSSRGNAISDDGSRYFFYAPNVTATDANGPGSGELWLRTDDGEDPPTTTRIGTGNVRFWFATPDGSKVIYTTVTAAGSWGRGGTLMLYDVESGVETELSETSHPDGPQASTVAAVTDDASIVYFTAGGKLTPDAPEWANNEYRLYMWSDDGEGGSIRFIADLGDRLDATVAAPDISYEDAITYDERISADGSVFAFRSSAQLTNYDNEGEAMVYVYDADANGGEGELRCASCNPSGASPVYSSGDGAFITVDRAQAQPKLRQLPRGMSADGSKVYFSTADPLTPEDTNGDKYDAYVYDVESGEAELISSGTGSRHSYYADHSEDGKTITFYTGQRLVGWDTDSSVDLYAAVKGGGFAEPEIEVACEGDSCQGDLPMPPDAEAPATGAFAGSGNTPDRPGNDCASLRRRAAVGIRKARRLARRAKQAKGKAKRRLLQKSTRAKKGAKRAKRRAARCERGERS